MSQTTNAPVVDWRKPEPNPLWPDEIRLLIRFRVHPKRVKCAICDRKMKVMWTMLCPFVAHSMTGFTMVPSDPLQPLAEVCADHPIAPRADIMEVIQNS